MSRISINMMPRLKAYHYILCLVVRRQLPDMNTSMVVMVEIHNPAINVSNLLLRWAPPRFWLISAQALIFRAERGSVHV